MTNNKTPASCRLVHLKLYENILKKAKIDFFMTCGCFYFSLRKKIHKFKRCLWVTF